MRAVGRKQADVGQGRQPCLVRRLGWQMVDLGRPCTRLCILERGGQNVVAFVYRYVWAAASFLSTHLTYLSIHPVKHLAFCWVYLFPSALGFVSCAANSSNDSYIDGKDFLTLLAYYISDPNRPGTRPISTRSIRGTARSIRRKAWQHLFTPQIRHLTIGGYNIRSSFICRTSHSIYDLISTFEDYIYTLRILHTRPRQ